MRKRYFIFLLFLLATKLLFAKEVSIIKAELIAHQVYYNLFPNTRNVNDFTCNLVYTGDEVVRAANSINAPFYVFNYDNGFVIVAGDDILSPILGFSENGKFEIKDMPTNITYWMEQYEKQVASYRAGFDYYTKEAHAGWENLESVFVETRQGDNEKLLHTASWDQTSPYNNECPLVGTRRTVTGCVATAVAIVMKYHKWPNMGVGTFSYEWGTQTLSETFNTTYLWDEMPDVCYSVNQAKQVPLLMRHCGIFSQMDYGVSSSGAFTSDAVAGLINHMKYDFGITEFYREWFSDSEWTNMLKAEIDDNCPIIYGGSDESRGGHQFVFDGYKGDYFHINWGWGGYSDGYFLLASLNPYGQGTGGNDGGFTLGQSAVLGVKPITSDSKYNDVLAFYYHPNYEYRGITSNKKTFVQNVPFDLDVAYIANYSSRTYNGVARLVHCNKDGVEKTILSSNFSLFNFNQFGLKGFSVTDLIITSSIEAGDYICLKHKSTGTSAWKEVYANEGTVGRLVVGTSTSIQDQTNDTETEIKTNGSIISIISASEIMEYTIYTMSGEIIEKNNNINQDKTFISIENLNKGTFILQLKTKNGISSHKFSR